MNSLLPIETLGGTIRAHVTAGDKSAGKAEEHYKAAGIHLAEAKERIFKTKGVSWPIFLVTHCGLRQSRANELIALADGRVTLEGIRARDAEKKREARAAAKTKSPGRPGESGEKAKGNQPPRRESERTVLFRRIVDELSNASVEDLRYIDQIIRSRRKNGTLAEAA